MLRLHTNFGWHCHLLQEKLCVLGDMKLRNFPLEYRPCVDQSNNKAVQIVDFITKFNNGETSDFDVTTFLNRFDVPFAYRHLFRNGNFNENTEVVCVFVNPTKDFCQAHMECFGRANSHSMRLRVYGMFAHIMIVFSQVYRRVLRELCSDNRVVFFTYALLLNVILL